LSPEQPLSAAPEPAISAEEANVVKFPRNKPHLLRHDSSHGDSAKRTP
jgi:hypothetical protein